MIDIKNFKKPLIVAGHGIRLSGAIELFYKLLEKINIPVVTTFNGFDLMPSDHFNYVGRIGTLGTKEGNKILQNADLIIFLGTRNNIRQISYQWQDFAKNAKKIIVDIDEAELNKPTIKADYKYYYDVKEFIREWLNELN